jgi:hypothetical protein
MLLTQAEFEATRAKIEKLNARSIKKGWTGTIKLVGEFVTKTETGPSGLPVKREMIDAEIIGTAPKYEGWTFLARVEFDESGMVVFNAPGAAKVDRNSLRNGECDHCKINRYRKSVFVVRHDDGRQLQVGSTCLKDFLGWNINPVWVSTDLDSYSEAFGGFGHTDPVYATETVLAAAWAVIQRFGYVKSNDYGTPTKYTVQDVLDPRSSKARELAKDIAPYVADAYGMAAKIREWILSDDFRGDNDFVYNLKSIAAGEFCKPNKLGFLAYAPVGWAKSMEREIQRKQESEDLVNDWNGEIGDKLELTVTLKSIRFLDSEWGVTDLYTFVGDDGRAYKWFSSRTIFTEVSEDSMRIKGTVKKHDEYKGHKATVLTRVKVI